MYNTILKVVFLSTSYATIYLIRNQYKHTYDKENDTFRMIFLVMPCFVLACFINYYPNPQEVRDTNRAQPPSAAATHAAAPCVQILWTFSIYLESVAIMPQLFLLQKTEVRRPPPAARCAALPCRQRLLELPPRALCAVPCERVC